MADADAPGDFIGRLHRSPAQRLDALLTATLGNLKRETRIPIMSTLTVRSLTETLAHARSVLASVPHVRDKLAANVTELAATVDQVDAHATEISAVTAELKSTLGTITNA